MLHDYPKFRSELVLRWVADGLWDLYSPLIVDSDLVYNGRRIGILEAPVGTRTNGPSIPKIPVLYEAYRDRAWPPAVMHDYGYDEKCIYEFPQEVWDALFHELMEALYPGWQDQVLNDMAWAGVRIGGSAHFRKEESNAQ